MNIQFKNLIVDSFMSIDHIELPLKDLVRVEASGVTIPGKEKYSDKILEKLAEEGINNILEWNKGNHFMDPDRRTAKGFAWILKGINA